MNIARSKLTCAVLLAAASAVVVAQQDSPSYAGQQVREIKSLSANDIEQIRKGRGWGLAKAAELNGVPGPRHVLQLSDELGLSRTQYKQVEDAYDNMHDDAVRVGSDLLLSELRVDELFQQKSMNSDSLRSLLVEAAVARAELRYVHLSRHLEMLDILTPAQIATYNELRGYN